MSCRQVSVAVVGFGYWGSKHVRVLSGMPDVAVTIVDSDATRLAVAAGAFPHAQCAQSLDDVVDSVDAVVIATPPRAHGELALAATRAGRHVLVEKPLATSVAECEMLIAAAKVHGTILMSGHTFEHNAAVWKLRELASSGELGEIRYVDSARLNLGLYQNDVNVIWDLAPHDISIVNFVLGQAPVAVSAWGHSHARRGFEDVAHVHLRYPNSDVRAYIHVSWLDPCKVRRVTIVGSEKMAVYNDLAANEPIRIYDVSIEDANTSTSLHPVPVTYRRGSIVSPFVPIEEPLAVQDSHLVDCIRTGSRPRTDGTSGLEVTRVLEAATKSLRAGHEVQIGRSESAAVICDDPGTIRADQLHAAGSSTA
jgi:predicted dehydrogenase